MLKEQKRTCFDVINIIFSLADMQGIIQTASSAAPAAAKVMAGNVITISMKHPATKELIKVSPILMSISQSLLCSNPEKYSEHVLFVIATSAWEDKIIVIVPAKTVTCIYCSHIMSIIIQNVLVSEIPRGNLCMSVWILSECFCLNAFVFFVTQKVRVGALQCLTKFTALPEHVVLPQQDRVTRHLAAALDDHKRLVRQEAVNARTQW